VSKEVFKKMLPQSIDQETGRPGQPWPALSIDQLYTYFKVEKNAGLNQEAVSRRQLPSSPGCWVICSLQSISVLNGNHSSGWAFFQPADDYLGSSNNYIRAICDACTWSGKPP